MEHIAAILLLVGCNDALDRCRELPAPVPVFETVAECEDNLESSIVSYASDFPQILGQCIHVDPAAEHDDAELVWDITDDGTFLASFERPEIMVASTEKAGR